MDSKTLSTLYLLPFTHLHTLHYSQHSEQKFCKFVNWRPRCMFVVLYNTTSVFNFYNSVIWCHLWTVELNIQTETQNIKAILNGDLKGHFSKCYLKHDCKKPDQMNPGYPKNCAVPTKKFDQKWLWKSYRSIEGSGGAVEG